MQYNICKVKLRFSNIANNNAEIRLYKHFGFDKDLGQGVDGSLIADEIRYLNECYPELTNIDVKINSVGGSVQEGLSVCSAILDSKIPVTTINKGMAYSIAGVVAMCGHKRKMVDFGTFMMHEVSGGNDEDVIDLLTNSLAKIFDGTTALTVEKCRELMAKETWMSAEECRMMGLIDSDGIIPTNNKRPETTNKLELHNFYNKHINKKTMIKLNNILKLSNEASEDAQVEAVEKINSEKEAALAEVEKMKAEKAELETKISEAEGKLKTYEDAEATKETAEKEAVIENAIKEGKISKESKEEWTSSPMKSDKLKNLFTSLKATPSFTPAFVASEATNTGTDGVDKSKWTYSDYEKKDPAALLEIKNSNPVEFERLVKTINTTFKSKK